MAFDGISVNVHVESDTIVDVIKGAGDGRFLIDISGGLYSGITVHLDKTALLDLASKIYNAVQNADITKNHEGVFPCDTKK
jgi:hypothetical protein